MSVMPAFDVAVVIAVLLCGLLAYGIRAGRLRSRQERDE